MSYPKLDKEVEETLNALMKVLRRIDRKRDAYTSSGTHIAVEVVARQGAIARNLSGKDLQEFEEVVASYMARVEVAS